MDKKGVLKLGASLVVLSERVNTKTYLQPVFYELQVRNPSPQGSSMTELILVSPDNRSLRPLIESALANEFRLLQSAIRQTEQRLRLFEQEYQMPTAIFIQKFEQDEIDETLELAEWIGEFRLLKRLQEKASTTAVTIRS